MRPIPHETWKSFSRCADRRRIVILVSSHGEVYLAQLARLLGRPAFRVKQILYGYKDQYSVDLSPIALGLVQEKPTKSGVALEITAAGRRKARSMTAAEGRGDERMARRVAPHVAAQLNIAEQGAKRGRPSASTPPALAGDPSSVTWSVEVAG